MGLDHVFKVRLHKNIFSSRFHKAQCTCNYVLFIVICVKFILFFQYCTHIVASKYKWITNIMHQNTYGWVDYRWRHKLFSNVQLYMSWLILNYRLKSHYQKLLINLCRYLISAFLKYLITLICFNISQNILLIQKKLPFFIMIRIFFAMKSLWNTWFRSLDLVLFLLCQSIHIKFPLI